MKNNTIENQILSLARETISFLRATGKTVATAESCTGGMVSSFITAIPGASSVFSVGITAYSAEAKIKLLGVKESTLKETGTVSRNTAAEMAIGVRRLAGSDIGLSVTGVAGPGSHEGKPAGTVYLAISDEKHVKVTKLTVESTDRNEVRLAACLELLTALADYFERG